MLPGLRAVTQVRELSPALFRRAGVLLIILGVVLLALGTILAVAVAVLGFGVEPPQGWLPATMRIERPADGTIGPAIAVGVVALFALTFGGLTVPLGAIQLATGRRSARLLKLLLAMTWTVVVAGAAAHVMLGRRLGEVG